MSHDTFLTTEIYADSYVLTERLGTGGTGTVYRARHVTLQQERALKVLHRRRGISASETLRQLQLEASVFGRLGGNPSIVMPFDIGFDSRSQTHFLAMELLNGADLARWVSLEGPLSPNRTLTVMQQVASGLDAAHGYIDEQGRATPIVHRDLTPSNLFVVEPDGTSPRVKILDFGLAAVLDRTNVASQRRTGTALFRAYEQANALELVPQTDIWAVGLVVYFALTGHTYWRQRTAENLLEEITRAPLDPPSTRLREQEPAAQLPDGFDAWFLRCLQRVPVRRFPTAGEAISELEQCFARSGIDLSQPLAARPGLRAASEGAGPWRSYYRSVAATEVNQPARSGARSNAPREAPDAPLVALAEQFHPLLRNVLRLSDDLMTATGHYLAFPPESRAMLDRQLEGVTHHVVQYNEARDLLRRELGAYEGLLRDLHERGPFTLYEAAREALSIALAFAECFPTPDVPSQTEPLSLFARECTYWQAERVLLHAQLEQGRMRVRTLEDEVERAWVALGVPSTIQEGAALRGAELLDDYAEKTARLAERVREWIAAASMDVELLRERTWAMAPAIEAMNEAYARVDRAALSVRVALSASPSPFHRRVADALSSLYSFQWYEFRPLLNGPLVQVIRFLCRDAEAALDMSFEEDSPRWHRLVRTLERASQRYRLVR